MRVATLVMFGLLSSGIGCGEEERTGALEQVQGDTGLVFVDGDVVVPDSNDPDSTLDTSDTSDTDTDTADTDTADTDTAEADTADTDTADTDTDAADTDTTPLECEGDGACPNTACEEGRCVEGRCTLVPTTDGKPCNDGEVCTKEDQCVDGQCVGVEVGCDDGNACTIDSCTAGLGCSFTPKSCDDNNACTTDECKPALGCVSTAVVCGPVTNACQVASCDVQLGCLIGPAGPNTTCSDNDACTTSDRCDGMTCIGDPVVCDDNNACTNDACVAGGCAFTAIPGCASSPQCVGKLAGESCDDGDTATAGDMCLLGVCRGYTLTRIAGNTVANQQGLVLTEVNHGPDGWSVIYWLADVAFRNRFMIAKVDDPASPVTYSATLQERLFTGLRDGFVGDTNGRVWRYSAGAWTRTNAWDTAVGSSGRGAIYDLWTSRDRTSQGADGVRRIWLVGEQSEEGWVRLCVEQNGGVTCATHDLDDFEDSSIPQAISGIPLCSAQGGCTSSALVLGADAWDGGEFYNDTFENISGTATLWSQGRIPDEPVSQTTQGLVTWGTETALKAIAVGTNGYVVARRADGTWSNTLSLKEAQSSRTFNGAWQGAGVVVLAATRRVSSTVLAYELWTAPAESDVEIGASWTVHELVRGSNVNAAGLYDIHIRSTGEARAVGAIRRVSGVVDWLDGAVWVRTP